MFNKKELILSILQAQQKPLRLWPGVVIVLLQWIIRFILPLVSPDAIAIGIFGGVIGGLAVILWWSLFSRAPRFERLAAIVLMVVALLSASQLLHKSLATAMMGMMFPVYSIPVMSLAFIVWAVASRRFSDNLRRATMAGTILLASGFWVLLRTNGMDGEAHQYFAWRWSTTAEERLLFQPDDNKIAVLSDSAELPTVADWPGFRGMNRDARISGLMINTDWLKTPPVEIWRRPVGPGCSSFAIRGTLLFTQEQRGEYEMVSCYNLNTGEPVWRHSDRARFWDSHAGPGPRSTPTLSGDRVFTLGATGILNVLNYRDGSLIWSCNAAQDAGVKMPGWGYTGSPLVYDSAVVVSVSGKLVAYNAFTGLKYWSGADGGESYSSPHLMTIAGIKQILLPGQKGLAGFEASSGKALWEFGMGGVMSQVVQPAQGEGGDIFLSEGYTKGMKRIQISENAGGWTIIEKWTSDVLRQNLNDFIVHKGYIYGFEGPGLACIDAGNGVRKWRGGRYGGQIILLTDQDLLIVLSEKGDLVLVEATPDRFREVSRFPGIKGKTWNHPALAGNILVVRNSLEMAAFRLASKN